MTLNWQKGNNRSPFWKVFVLKTLNSMLAAVQGITYRAYTENIRRLKSPLHGIDVGEKNGLTWKGTALAATIALVLGVGESVHHIQKVKDLLAFLRTHFAIIKRQRPLKVSKHSSRINLTYGSPTSEMLRTSYIRLRLMDDRMYQTSI